MAPSSRALLCLVLATLSALLLSCCPAWADSAADESDATPLDSHVVILGDANFTSFLEDSPLSLIEFYAPWCGHCKALAPEYEQAASELKETPINLAKVDCTVEQALCEKHDIKGFPTLKVFRDGTPADYKGARKADSIVEYLKKQSLPALSDLDVDQVEEFSASSKVVLIGFVKSKDSPAYKTLEKVANQMRDDFVFGVSTAAKAAKAHDVKVPSLVLFKKFDEGKNVYEGALDDEKAVMEFIKVNSIPLVADIGPENYSSYVESGLPLAYLFFGTEEDKVKVAPGLEAAAKKFKGKINFVYIDGTKYGGHARNINLEETWPAFGIHESEANTKYPLDQSKEITADELDAFCQKFVDGELSPSVKSAPEPTEEEAAETKVKVLVGTTYDKIVNDKEKDVFVELYASWCGHCKRLTPIWEELAEKYASVPNVVIAKMEAVDNDLPAKTPFRIEGFPTIKLVKAGDNEILDYQGDRTVEAFVEFLEANAVNKGGFIPEDSAADADKPADDQDLPDEHDEL